MTPNELVKILNASKKNSLIVPEELFNEFSKLMDTPVMREYISKFLSNIAPSPLGIFVYPVVMQILCLGYGIAKLQGMNADAVRAADPATVVKELFKQMNIHDPDTAK